MTIAERGDSTPPEVRRRPLHLGFAHTTGHASPGSPCQDLEVTRSLAVGAADPTLDPRLSDELSNFNTAAVPGPSAVELTVSCTDTESELLGGISGWTWQEAAGIGMTWVHAAQRSTGLGSQLLAEFERTAAARGARRVSAG